VGALVTSDRAVSGERDDQCIPALRKALQGTCFSIVETRITSDDADAITSGFTHLLSCDLDLLFTSGGTGCGPRDNTPEATRPFIERLTPGVDEAIRRFSAEKSTYAAYSRGVSGISGRTFIINLPGSPKAVAEIVAFLLPTITHPLQLLSGDSNDCADTSRM